MTKEFEKVKEMLFKSAIENTQYLVKRFKEMQKENEIFKKQAEEIKKSFGKIRKTNGKI
jgi:hypothetical protein